MATRRGAGQNPGNRRNAGDGSSPVPSRRNASRPARVAAARSRQQAEGRVQDRSRTRGASSQDRRARAGRPSRSGAPSPYSQTSLGVFNDDAYGYDQGSGPNGTSLMQAPAQDQGRGRRGSRSARSPQDARSTRGTRDARGARTAGTRSGRSSRSGRDSQGRGPKKKGGINKKKVIIGIICFLLAILLTGATLAIRYVVKLNNSLSFDHDVKKALQAELVDTVKISDPFWILLLGIDDDEGSGISRSDTIILARINPQNLTAVLISIPRDTRVLIPGFGYDKINAAHAYGGPGLAVKTVSQFADVPISHYAECDFRAFFNLVDALGGVTVDVPVYVPAISSDNTPIYDANGNPLPSLEPGVQKLDGAGALIFCRSRHYDNGDYQRQANQRTFLKALAGELLNADMATLLDAAQIIAEGVSTDLSVQSILQIAQSLHGMNMEDIYSYTVPSYMDMIDEISFVLADEYAWQSMIQTIKDGGFPDTQDASLSGEAGVYANANAGESGEDGYYEEYSEEY